MCVRRSDSRDTRSKGWRRERYRIAPDGAAGSTTIDAVSALKLWPEDGMTMSIESPLCCRPSTRSTVRPSTDALRATSEATEVSRDVEEAWKSERGREVHGQSSQPPKFNAEQRRHDNPLPYQPPNRLKSQADNRTHHLRARKESHSRRLDMEDDNHRLPRLHPPPPTTSGAAGRDAVDLDVGGADEPPRPEDITTQDEVVSDHGSSSRIIITDHHHGS